MSVSHKEGHYFKWNKGRSVLKGSLWRNEEKMIVKLLWRHSLQYGKMKSVSYKCLEEMLVEYTSLEPTEKGLFVYNSTERHG